MMGEVGYDMYVHDDVGCAKCRMLNCFGIVF